MKDMCLVTPLHIPDHVLGGAYRVGQDVHLCRVKTIRIAVSTVMDMRSSGITHLNRRPSVRSLAV